jgi:hypothetical protein
LQKGAPIWRVQDLLGERDEARQGAPRGMGEMGGGSSGTVIRFGIALLFLCEALICILQLVSSDEAVRRLAR